MDIIIVVSVGHAIAGAAIGATGNTSWNRLSDPVNEVFFGAIFSPAEVPLFIKRTIQRIRRERQKATEEIMKEKLATDPEYAALVAQRKRNEHIIAENRLRKKVEKAKKKAEHDREKEKEKIRKQEARIQKQRKALGIALVEQYSETSSDSDDDENGSECGSSCTIPIRQSEILICN